VSQGNLFDDDIYDALSSCVESLGKAKKVGSKLWPAMPIDAAGRKLSDCLNPENAQKLSLEEFWLILRWAREKDVHTFARFFAQSLDYDFTPITAAVKAARADRDLAQVRLDIAKIAASVGLKVSE